MAPKRQLELHLLRFMPHALRDDFVTLGFLLLESDGGFAQLEFTRDWKMLQCVAPHVEMEWLQVIEREIRGKIKELPARERLVQAIEDQFGTMVEVAPPKAVLTDDPAKEIEMLAEIYLKTMQRAERGQQRAGRVAIVSAMEDAFTEAGVLGLMQRDLDLGRYTGAGDPFRIDFGYRLGASLKMFHAVSVAANVDQALALAYRFGRLENGVRREQLEASLTAVVDQSLTPADERARFGLEMLQENRVRVRPVDEMAEIAGEVRRELRV